MELEALHSEFGIIKLDPDSLVPDWLYQSSFYSISKSENELSLVCEHQLIPENDLPKWKAFRVKGQLDFALTGILNELTKPLADAEIPVFAVSTYDTDYLLVHSGDFEKASSLLCV